MSRRNGIWVILDATIKTKLVEVIRKSGQILGVKIILEASIVSVIIVYAIHIECTEDEKNII